jgi:hypothetical protein
LLQNKKGSKGLRFFPLIYYYCKFFLFDFNLAYKRKKQKN